MRFAKQFVNVSSGGGFGWFGWFGWWVGGLGFGTSHHRNHADNWW